jgi:predicted AAA+ superfamily ATPase
LIDNLANIVTGHEIDCIIEENNRLIPIEIKSGETITSDYFKNLDFWKSISNSHERGFVVYGGDQVQKREKAEIVPWDTLEILFTGLKRT